MIKCPFILYIIFSDYLLQYETFVNNIFSKITHVGIKINNYNLLIIYYYQLEK